MIEPRRILLLVDDPAELAGLNPLFSEIPGDWKVCISRSPEDALCQLAQVTFDMVFVDLKAGAFAGTQFLHEVWGRHPNVIRFLLAPSADPDLMVTCALGPHQFLQKPLDLISFCAAIERATLVDELFREPSVKHLVSRIRTFPTRPTVYVAVMRELRSKDSSVQTVADLVAGDFAISTKLLQITNSAFYGFQQRVSTPGEAVMLLGMETTSSLVLGIEAFAWLDKLKLHYFSSDHLWKHCQSVANSAKAIAQFVTGDTAMAQEAFTAALLHDIGKLALAVNFEEKYRIVLSEANTRNLPSWQVEKEVFGTTHAEAGAYLLTLWGLSASTIQAVAQHHWPAHTLPKTFSAATAVHLANLFAHTEAPQPIEPVTEADFNYPPELNLASKMDAIRELARENSKPIESTSPIVCRREQKTPLVSTPEVQLAAKMSPDGWWARFRSLLAA